jgi:uncharacterized protein
MYAATLDEAEWRFGTRTPVFNYRWEHVRAVTTLAVRLAQLTGADLDVVEAAAWLHDVRKEAKEEHPQEGAAFAREFLAQTDFPADKIEPVAEAIKAHMGLYRDEPIIGLEAQVLWDADKLSKTGLTAAAHWLGLDLASGRELTTFDFLTNGKSVDWHQKSLDSMHTAPARAAAEGRLQAFRWLWNQLEAELRGEDLGL